MSTTTIQLRSDIVHRDEAFGGILFDLETKDYFPVNPTGYYLVQSLSTRRTLLDLRYMLQHYYADNLDLHISAKQAATIVDTFVATLQAKNIITASSACTVAAHSAAPAPQMDTLRLKSPLVVSLAIIFQCNLHCTHCYVSSTNEAKADNLTTEEIYAILDQLKAAEVFDVVITGGEALMFNKVLDVLRYAKAQGFYVCLNTNGTIMTPQIARTLKAIDIDVVKISLDSPDAATHNAFRQQYRAFERSTRTIQTLVAHGIRTDVHTVLCADAIQSEAEVEAMIDLAKTLGAAQLHFGKVFATGRATEQLKVTNQRIRDLCDYVAQRKQDEPLIGRYSSGHSPTVASLPTYDGCGSCAKDAYVYISYNGGIYPCTNMYKPAWQLGDLRQNTLAEILDTNPVLTELRGHLAGVAPASSQVGEV